MNKLISFAIGTLSFFLAGNPLSHTTDNCDFHCRVCRADLFSEFDRVSENLYHGKYSDIRHAIKLWEESPDHLDVLDDKYDYAILLVYPDKSDGYYIILNTAK